MAEMTRDWHAREALARLNDLEPLVKAGLYDLGAAFRMVRLPLERATADPPAPPEEARETA